MALGTKDYNRIIGENIRYYRRRREITQERLAGLSSTSTAYISKLELGAKNPTVEVLQRIARALDVSLAELTDREIYLGRIDGLSWAADLEYYQERLAQKTLAVQRAVSVLLEYLCQ